MHFREVVIQEPSTATMRAFYGDALELTIVSESNEEIAFRAGPSTLRFRRSAPGTAPTYHFALRVPGNKFAEARSWLGERTKLVREDDQDEFDWGFWGARAVYACDPAGNIIELISFSQLPSPSDAPFSSDSFIGLAELGLPVADPHAAVRQLSDMFGIGLWDGNEVNANGLTPVGEQEATFLVTPVGRRWLFGDTAADHPLEVVLGGVLEGSLEFARPSVPDRGSRLILAMQVRLARHPGAARRNRALLSRWTWPPRDRTLRGSRRLRRSLPGAARHQRTPRVTTGGLHGGPASPPETLLVLYLGSPEAVNEACCRVACKPVDPANPYWTTHGVTLVDPDGFRVPDMTEKRHAIEMEEPETKGRPTSTWGFLTNHAHVLLCIARDPESRARDK